MPAAPRLFLLGFPNSSPGALLPRFPKKRLSVLRSKRRSGTPEGVDIPLLVFPGLPQERTSYSSSPSAPTSPLPVSNPSKRKGLLPAPGKGQLDTYSHRCIPYGLPRAKCNERAHIILGELFDKTFTPPFPCPRCSKKLRIRKALHHQHSVLTSDFPGTSLRESGESDSTTSLSPPKDPDSQPPRSGPRCCPEASERSPVPCAPRDRRS